jgi:bifunctional UDP-N-acetylglucosamine pyrophosphorylase/glucosamine-1-phosphate N-acetyltransferase
MKIIGIILAAGEGTRIKTQKQNKTALKIKKKPLVQYGVELLQGVVSQTVIVVGAYAQSVKAVIKGQNIYYAHQKKRLGTGHATLIALKAIEEKRLLAELVLIGYGDHMMFYTPRIIRNMVEFHKKQKAVLTIITTEHNDPMRLAWGRIIRKKDNSVGAIIEQKDANKEQLKVSELNAGFYCVDYNFLREAILDLEPSSITGEYYLTDIVELANKAGKKVAAYKVPFKYVGIGVNTSEQLQQASKLKQKV